MTFSSLLSRILPGVRGQAGISVVKYRYGVKALHMKSFFSLFAEYLQEVDAIVSCVGEAGGSYGKVE